ncbi:MAG: hypothetical protein AAFQ87_01970 [Bacteroidota bacterium]
MKSLFGIFSFCLLSVALFSCGPQIPTEAEVMAKIKGTYCAEKYRLVLEDSTYRCRRFSPGIISSTPIRESCKGTYSLAMSENQWVINFNKDPRPQGIQNCERSFVIWNAEQNYLIEQEDKTIMWELFDEKPLTKGVCED